MTTPRTTMLLALVSMATVALAGCSDSGEAVQEAELDLTSNVDEATAGSGVRFQASADKALQDATYVFDFGDGETATVEGGGSAEAEHTYEVGGTYTVTASLMDGNETVAEAEHQIHIFEDHDHAAQVVASGPLANQTATATWDLEAGDNATQLVTNLSLENSAVIGQSVIRIDVVDAEGAILASKNVTLGEGETLELLLEVPLAGAADLELRAVAESGSASISGQSQVRYD